jgi:hypothetical protein
VASDPKYAGKSMWGVEWKDKSVVDQYRLARNHPTNVAPPGDLQKKLDEAEAKVITLQKAVDDAKANHGDVVGAQNQLNAANAEVGQLYAQMKQVAGPAPKPKWLEKFDIVLPETVVGPQ